MSFLDKMKAAVGIGAVDITVQPLEPNHFRGGLYHGVVYVVGGQVEQHVNALTVQTVEYWVVQSGKNRTRHYRERDSYTLATSLMVVPDSKQHFSFEFQIPSDARCSRRSEGVMLRARADIPSAVDQRAETPLKVLPHPEILAIQRCLRDQFGFIQHQWDGSRQVVMYDFVASEALRSVVDGVTLRVEVAGDHVVGEIVVNRQESGVGGFLNSMIGADKERLQVSIPRSDLLTKKGSPNPAGAVAPLKELFAKADVTL